ncbi:MAG TPA: hypothetical protein P5244_14975, partial [Syntrophales bacterium]|nr:hypothetical protein [Syntrophales bacterium]
LAAITSPGSGSTPGSASARIRKSQTWAWIVRPDSSATSKPVFPKVALTVQISGGLRYSTGHAA